ncbi:MAG: hypothetical protein LBT74_07610 [Acidobacteriota bacterium]|jgi:hypothetical protein|nr:hypothetical protein [Acidobacteriota bacterium]
MEMTSQAESYRAVVESFAQADRWVFAQDISDHQAFVAGRTAKMQAPLELADRMLADSSPGGQSGGYDWSARIKVELQTERVLSALLDEIALGTSQPLGQMRELFVTVQKAQFFSTCSRVYKYIVWLGQGSVLKK